jgi:hypothetical protein
MLRAALQAKGDGFVPAYEDLARINLDQPPVADTGGGRRLETFIVDRVVACHEGHVTEGQSIDVALESVFFRRSGPIAAAIAVTIDAGAGQHSD